MNREKDKTRLLMNSKEIRDFRAWLLEDMLFDFRIGRVKIAIWKTFPFVIIIMTKS